MPRREDVIADLGVHPGELGAGLAGREEAVARIDPDAVSRSFEMETEDLLQRRQDLLREAVVARRRDVGKSGLEEPERGVDCVVLGRLAAVGESIRQKSSIAVGEEGADDVARLVKAASRKEQAGQRDHRVAAPVGEPGIAGDHRRAAVLPPHHVLLGGVGEARSERIREGR